MRSLQMSDESIPPQNLNEEEQEQAAKVAALRPHVIHEVVREEGEIEIRRSFAALGWSGFAAGGSMGFSFLGMALLRATLPDEPWRHAIESFGYTLGFIIVILGRQQLYTESTLTAGTARADQPELGGRVAHGAALGHRAVRQPARHSAVCCPDSTGASFYAGNPNRAAADFARKCELAPSARICCAPSLPAG